IRFVHYFMHDPETPETPRQVCIREEQEDKFIPYLECFLEDGDSVRCIIEAEVDEAAMDECISNGNAEKYYAEDSALSQEYGVSGSPTLVVNGVIASSGRDSQSYLNAVCGSFNTPPEVCVTAEVSSASPAPGFGWDETGSATTASC
ncbi:DsbA family protein, partial [Candidatus Pacearchaeota archaeon]|nr:DsbA family protein [Candidatus Pacearchaeota archaeon]